MSDFLNYPLISLAMASTIKRSNIVAVKRNNWKTDKSSIANYLTSYKKEDIKRGKLETISDSGNVYSLEGGKEKYDLILFVVNSFELGDDTDPSTYTCIGAVELPEIGWSGSSSEKLQISFSESTVLYNLGDFTKEKLEVTVNTVNYSDTFKDNGYVNIGSLKKEYRNISKPDIKSNDNEDSIAFIPDGVMYKNKIYRKEPLDLDLSNYDIISYQSISHKNTEFIRFISSTGTSVLRNVTERPSSTLFSNTTSTNVRVTKENSYESLLNPDYIVTTNLVNRSSFIIPTEDYIDGGYIFISDCPDSIKTKVSSKLHWGTDIWDNNVSTVYSDPSRDLDWFLQGKYSKLFKNHSFLFQNYVDYSVEVHNSRIFILRQYKKNTSTLIKKVAIDYEGNYVELLGDYKLDIDGALIVTNSNGTYTAYRGSLKEGIIITSSYDLYNIFPSATELIWNYDTLDLSKVLICRDRLQNLN